MENNNEAKQSSDIASTFESVVVNLRNRLLQEVDRLDTALEDEEATTEHRFKTYTGYFKMVQGIEMMINGIKQQREQESEKRIEVVEFRRQLEEQIARLVDTESAIPVSGGVE